MSHVMEQIYRQDPEDTYFLAGDSGIHMNFLNANKKRNFCIYCSLSTATMVNDPTKES